MTSQTSSRQYLQQQLILAEKSKNWLEHSLRQAESINQGELSTVDYDILEALSSRYGRFVDILINKLFRAVDLFELMDAGTLIDTLNRAEKRGIITADTGRELKELRNLIVHEYDPVVVSKLANDIIQYAQVAIKVHARLLSYLTDTHKFRLPEVQ